MIRGVPGVEFQEDSRPGAVLLLDDPFRGDGGIDDGLPYVSRRRDSGRGRGGSDRCCRWFVVASASSTGGGLLAQQGMKATQANQYLVLSPRPPIRYRPAWPVSASTSTRSPCCAIRAAPGARHRPFARLALESGAEGLTVHPRPDERHIRRSDVTLIAELMRADRPAKEFNIEGYPEERLMAILRDVRPEQCTLVPDAPDAFTSEEGWHLDNAQANLAHPAIAAIKALGARVILFIDPDRTVVPRVRRSGATGWKSTLALTPPRFVMAPMPRYCARSARRRRRPPTRVWW